MAKKTLELDTPFKKGEKVVATRDLEGIPGGTQGKVQLANGLGSWRRYWVMFEGDRQMGQVSHDDLTRPDQLRAWMARQEDLAEAARRQASASEAASEATSAADAGSGGGIASQIPAALLERSKAAKARLLG